MPTYEYSCTKCSKRLEAFQSMSDDPLLRCPSCGEDALQRMISGGGGLVFKGSGFYQTDYKSPPKDAGKKETAEAGAPKTDSGSGCCGGGCGCA